MTTDPQFESRGRPDQPGGPTRAIVAGITLLALLGVGWFVMSWRVMHTPPSDAGGEAVGVVLALLIVVSVIGAIRGRNRSAH